MVTGPSDGAQDIASWVFWLGDLDPPVPSHRGPEAPGVQPLAQDVVADIVALRLVVLPPEQWYAKDAPQQATTAVQDYLKMRGDQPRHRANRLLFLAADQAMLSRLKDAMRAALAWESIVKDVDEGRLNIDQNQKTQAVKESQTAATVLPRVARECFKWLLCPAQADPKADRPEIEAYPLNTTVGSAAGEPGRVCKDNELVIEAWSPIHLRSLLKQFYWKQDRPAVAASSFWEDSLRYLYLPRLKDREVFGSAVRDGAASRDFFGTAYGEAGGEYEGFQLGGSVTVVDTLLLIEAEAGARHTSRLGGSSSTQNRRLAIQ